MKKHTLLLSLTLAAALLLSACGAAPAASGSVSASPAASSAAGPEEDGFVPGTVIGLWQDRVSQRASLAVTVAEQYDPDDPRAQYDFRVTWGSSAWERTVWTMKAYFDDQTGAFTYTDGQILDLTTDDASKEVHEDLRWADTEGAFTLDDEGCFRWTDSRTEQAADCVFEQLVLTPPDPAAFTERWFRPVAALQPGTAGASLKQAAAVRDVLIFCCDEMLWTCDMDTLRANLLTAWESLAEEERASFDANLLADGGFAGAVTAALREYPTVQAVYADAGADEEMTYLVAQRETALSWDTLLAHTLTMGNGED